ncbi:MAG: polyprenyl diphosphate synthase, partial [Bacteroidota bacterium]|nr:polyprenyl diphosphate synthase [Bacteroidota bacterium]
PKIEVSALMSLLDVVINDEANNLMEKNIKFRCIGDINELPKKTVESIEKIKALTKENNGLNLILAINYSGRWDIQNAVKRILSSKKNNILENFNEKDFEKYLSTSNIPDPELLIRTSGEQRISNFYLWQTAYTELYFTDILWPDFNKKELNNAIFEFNKRNRRFGKV